MKEPECKYCGGKHYQFRCWQKPKTVPKAKTHADPVLYRAQAKKKRKTTMTSNHVKYTRQKLIKELDTTVSILVRRGNADTNGIVVCYTCGRQGHWKSFDCGHFWKRRRMHTRWDLNNLRPQCRECNRDKGGNYEVYRRKMKSQLGVENYEKLRIKACRTDKIPLSLMEVMLKKYKESINGIDF